MHQTDFVTSPIQSATDFLDFVAKDSSKKNKEYISDKESHLRNRQTYLGSISFTWRCTDNNDPVIPKLTDTKSININVLKSIDVKLKLT